MVGYGQHMPKSGMGWTGNDWEWYGRDRARMGVVDDGQGVLGSSRGWTGSAWE